jgi:hypothetical protein
MGDTCLRTGQTYAELDYYNIGTNESENWKPFVNEDAYLAYMADLGREIPDGPLPF